VLFVGTDIEKQLPEQIPIRIGTYGLLPTEKYWVTCLLVHCTSVGADRSLF